MPGPLAPDIGAGKYMKYIAPLLLLCLAGCATNQPAPPLYKYVFITNAGPVVVVSDATPDPYTHPTTHPGSLFDELNIDIDKGHADGGEMVSFAGKVVCVEAPDIITPIPNVNFYWLYTDRKELLPFTTDTNGTFQTKVGVWTAYGYIKGKTNEGVMYQSTTAYLGAEAPGYEMRKVNVRYQQPSTLIVLKKTNGGHGVPDYRAKARLGLPPDVGVDE